MRKAVVMVLMLVTAMFLMALLAVGSDDKGYLGINVYEQEGKIVLKIWPNGPAEIQGLESGDVVLSIDNKTISSVDDVKRTIKEKRDGDIVSMTIRRGAETLVKKVTLGKEPAPNTTKDEKAYTNSEQELQKYLIRRKEGERKRLKRVIEKVESATVLIPGAGTGFIVKDGIYVVTAGHIASLFGGVGGTFTIVLQDGRRYRALVVEMRDKNNGDLAVAAIGNEKNDILPSLEFGDADVGDLAFVVGFPSLLGKDKEGKVVSTKRSAQVSPLVNLGVVCRARATHTSFASMTGVAPIQGNSGSPIINGKGEVIGIIVDVDIDNTNAGYGVSGKVLDFFVEDVEKVRKGEK